MTSPQLVTFATWIWIPLTLWAAFAQTVRNAAQRSLTTQAGTLAATLARFLYGLPFALLWVLVVQRFTGSGTQMPAFHMLYVGWTVLGAIAQVLATALLLKAMQQRNFIVGVAFSKTEVLQVALFSTFFLSEVPTAISVAAMVLATAGVVLLSLPRKPSAMADAEPLNRVALFGIASGACFALSAVGYRGASLTMPGVSPWLLGAWGVLIAQTVQSVLLGGYLAITNRAALVTIARVWRLSILAGMMGAAASIGWFTAMSVRPAADVRTLGLIEVFFSYLVSMKIFREKLSTAERTGLALVLIGLIGICAQL
jgi:drug/metabolite transporter (DMT)-like permease